MPVGEVAVGDEYLSSIDHVSAVDLLRNGPDMALVEEQRLLDVGAGFGLGDDEVEQVRLAFLFAFRHVAEDPVENPRVE